MRYAEVIGDPVGHSKSPAIHKYWLDQLELSGDYRRTYVPRGTLADHLSQRRTDLDWRGCNVTIPHKEDAAKLVQAIDKQSSAIGAMNCIVNRADGLWGTNTDIDGVAAALNSTALEGSKVAIIGGGGAARAAVAYLAGRSASQILILVRDPKKAESLRTIAPQANVEIVHLDSAGTSIADAVAIINATQMGMDGCAAMPAELIHAVARHCRGITLFDMVYDPVETPFLSIGKGAADRIADGLTMLIGQAARAFQLFYEVEAPPPDEALRRLLITGVPEVSLGYNLCGRPLTPEFF